MIYDSSTFGFEQVSLLGSSHKTEMKLQAADRTAENNVIGRVCKIQHRQLEQLD